MVILALDTTHPRGSLALARDGEILEAVPVEAPDGFGHVIFQEIEALLGRYQMKLADIDCYAAASGPGSFTGIRVGLSVVKSLAEAHRKTVVPVSNLLAIAAAAEGGGEYLCPVMDARRGEVYAAVYDRQLRPVVPETAATWAALLRLLGEREVTFAATDAELFSGAAAAPLDAGSYRGKRVVVSPLLALPIARLAAARQAEGTALAPEAVEANYVRRADAELKWRDPGA